MKGPIYTCGTLLMAALLVACGGGGGGDGASCSPAPAITSTLPTSASVNQQYQYQVDFTLACIPFFTACGFELLQAPPGAGIDRIRSAVFWTPAASDTNQTVQFTIATFTDLCGHRATQSWLVLVSP